MKSGTTSGGAPPGVVPEAQERRFPRGENSDGERDFRAAFDDQGNYPNAADTVFRKIATVLAPDHAPPTAPGH